MQVGYFECSSGVPLGLTSLTIVRFWSFLPLDAELQKAGLLSVEVPSAARFPSKLILAEYVKRTFSESASAPLSQKQLLEQRLCELQLLFSVSREVHEAGNKAIGAQANSIVSRLSAEHGTCEQFLLPTEEVSASNIHTISWSRKSRVAALFS